MSDETAPVHLDIESRCDGEGEPEDEGAFAAEPIEFDRLAAAGAASANPLVLRIKKRAGRASAYRKRSSYSFDPGTDGDDERESASERGRQANHRKAIRRAADEALVNQCTIWVTVTFDDLHRSNDPAHVTRTFLRRLQDRYRSSRGRPLKYVGVVGAEVDGREHFHVLLSHDVDHSDVRESWRHGQQINIQEIEDSEIEQKVRYMAAHVEGSRVTFGRFIRSRTPGVEVEEFPIDGIDEGRAVLEDIVYPQAVRVERAQVLGPRTCVAFRFDPIRGDDQ